jgi:hypothetical protein
MERSGDAENLPGVTRKPDLEAARNCQRCYGWGTVVAPTGRGLVLCPDCQHP